MYDVRSGSFEWNEQKNRLNQEKHGISFEEAKLVFLDPQRLRILDWDHSDATEIRYYCVGIVNGGIVTVRYTVRGEFIRIIGAEFWRKGRALYEKANRQF